MKFNNIQESLDEIIDNNYLVIVEGKKDKKALNNLGVRNIISLENRPLFEVVESIEEKDIVILTDLDAEGRKLFNNLRHHLQRRRFKLHNKIRKELFKMNLINIEGLKQQHFDKQNSKFF